MAVFTCLTDNCIFNFNRCLENANLSNDEKVNLEKIYDLYKERTPLSEEQEQKYLKLSKKLTNKIKEI